MNSDPRRGAAWCMASSKNAASFEYHTHQPDSGPTQFTKMSQSPAQRRKTRISKTPRFELTTPSPQRPRIQPLLDIPEAEPRTPAIFAGAAAELIFAREPRRPPLAQPVDLSPGKPRQAGEFLGRDHAVVQGSDFAHPAHAGSEVRSRRPDRCAGPSSCTGSINNLWASRPRAPP